MAAQDDPAPSGLFGIFLLTIYSLLLIPYTLYRLCSAGEVKTQAAVKGKKKDDDWKKAASRLLTKGNLLLLAAWLAWVGLLLYVQSASGDAAPFDPFEILGVERGASDRDVKKAYRRLSLQYHPDKNPDPKAAAYFASHISKAYAALTDEVSRLNYEKYGHPDGPQGMNLGVALPAWMFNKDKKTAPLMLLALVGGCILLPLAIASYYMLKGDHYSGPNRIHNGTLFAYAATKYGVKESQSLVRVPETLLVAYEFVSLYTPSDHHAPCEELRKLVAPAYPDVMGRDKKAFWQRRASVIKAHMLLLAHLERLGPLVPPALQPDLKFVRQKCPPLLEEMVKIACLPRNNLGWGWMTPALASVEMMQCVACALPTSLRKGGPKGGDATAALLALPHITVDVAKRLRKQRVNALKDLLALGEQQLIFTLDAAGVRGDAADEVAAALSAFPAVAVSAAFEVDGEDEVCERDPVHCRARVLLTRRSHAAPGFRLCGAAVRAFTPCNPEPQDEAWYAFLTDPAGNHVVAWTKANLMDAEAAGLEHGPSAVAELAKQGAAGAEAALPGGGAGAGAAAGAASSTAAAAVAAAAAAPAAEAAGKGGSGGGAKPGGKAGEPPGQVLDLVFMAPAAGRYDWTLHLVSSTWVGADVALPLKLKVAPLTRAAAEGRDAKSLSKKKFGSDSDSDAASDAGREAGSGSGSEDESDDEDDDDDGSGYDSEETGEEVSSDEEEAEAAAAPAVEAAAGEDKQEQQQQQPKEEDKGEVVAAAEDAAEAKKDE